MSDPTEQLRAAISNAGLHPPSELVADGKLHRFASNGKSGDDAGWYVLHGDGIPAGAFGDWRTGASETWRADMGRPLSREEEGAHRVRTENMRREREAEDARRNADARTKAEAIWRAAKTVSHHPYLDRKSVKAHGLREHDGALVVPMREGAKLHSLQFIGADGEKRFLAGGRVSGCYFAIGGSPRGPLCIAEGYATGASIHEATGNTVAVAFNAGNLLPVARTLRAKFPDLRVILCADDDAATPGNPGLAKAREAALSVGGSLAVPGFGDNRPDNATDFNDLHRHGGLAAVRASLERASPVEDLRPTSSTECHAEPARVELVNATAIDSKPIQWLWPGWLAKGKMHVLAGAPGTGKTTIALHWAACITAAAPLPSGWKPPPGRVLIWSGEDDIADTLKPRLVAAGANLSLVQFIGGVREDGKSRPFDPAYDVPALAEVIAGIDLAMLVIDPLVSAVGGDSHKNAEVRRSLAPLVELAQAKDAALLGITHYSKGTQGREPLERVSGSLAFGALARIVYGTVREQSEGDDSSAGRYLLARVKSNIGPDGGAYAYSFEQTENTGGITASRVVWGQAVEGTARELLAEAECDPEEDGRDIVTFLRDLLADGPMPAKEVRRHADDAGYSWRTVQRAMRRAGVQSHRAGFGKPASWALGSGRATVAPVTPHSESGANGANDMTLAQMDRPNPSEVEAFDL